MLKKLKLSKKPLFQKRRWSCDFPPRKMPVALKHRAISRQEKMAFSAPVGLSWDSPPPPTECADGRTYGCTDGRSRDHCVTTKISRIDRLQEGVMNLGLGTSAGIGERKSEVSGHRDVTNKSVREIQRKGNKWLPCKCLPSSFSKRTDQNDERTKGMLHAIT